MDNSKFRSFLFIFIELLTIQIVEIYCKRSFILIAPKKFDIGEKESLHLTILDIDTPGTVSVSLVNLKGKLLSVNKTDFDKAGSKRIELEVPPDATSLAYHRMQLKVEGTFGKYKFVKAKYVDLRYYNELIFLDTDKPFYKAGQTVKFRVLIMKPDLKPSKINPMGSIWITDRNRVRLAQWMNITFENGFIHEEMKLPEEPVLGTWTLHVQVNSLYKTKNFNITEYVLPTFEVKITPPSMHFGFLQNITWNICANYTYGKPVQGKLFIELKSDTYDYLRSRLKKEIEIHGCTEVTLNAVRLLAYPPKYLRQGLKLYAQVTEYGTDTKMNATAIIYDAVNWTLISRADNRQYFRAGLPFRNKLAVRNQDSIPVVNRTVKVCVQRIRLKWKSDRESVDKSIFCRSYKTDQQGKVVITIPPQPSDTVEIKIKAIARVIDKKQYDSKNIIVYSLIPWYSFTGHFLQIEPLDSAVECGSTVEFEVLYTAKHSETRKIYYQVLSKGDVVHDGFLKYAFDIKDDLANYHDETYLRTESETECYETDKWIKGFPILNHIGKFTLKFDVDLKMSPKAHLILYSVNEEGNLFADSTSFEVKPCFANPVKLKFSEERQLPGTKTIIQLSAAPQSICSIGIVDKSVHLMEQGDVISKSKVYDQLRFLDTSEPTPSNQIRADNIYCYSWRSDDIKHIRRVKAAGYVDTLTAFKKAGVIALSNLRIETRPCLTDVDNTFKLPLIINFDEQEIMSFSYKEDSSANLPEIPQPENNDDVTVRSYFPETWLWGIHFVGKDGELFLEEKLPDSITEWQGTSVCLHPDEGLGISESASIIGFQPFFAFLTLPYSVIRGETVPIIVTVFNYLKECLPIKIHLDQTDDFQLHNGTLTFNDCLCGGKSVTRRYFINPKTLGKVIITATATTNNDKEVCNNVDVTEINKSDTLTKTLIVEAEGFPKEETLNVVICTEDLKDGIYENNYDILHEEDIIEGSARTLISVTGDIMGPTLEGLENLVRVPTGCGEQNMILLVPNIVVLDYLIATHRLTDEIRQKAIHHIKEGYMREQNYRHSDGSYSAFGKYDQTGSMWLTAFVVRSFASAARYIELDKDDLEKSRDWIISHQQDNGCFPIIGMVHHKQMKGGVKEDKNPAILTAYVLTSLLLSGDVNETVIERAVKCIEAKLNLDDYALSLIAYATSFIDEAVMHRYLGELKETAITEGFNYYWKNKDKSIAIEIASYAILSLFNLKDNERALFESRRIAKWLTLQRNPYGGFISTQDTIIALEALAKYASRIKRETLNMTLTVRNNDLEKVFELHEGNELLTQIIRMPTLPTTIDIESKGEGCAVVQAVHRYNVPNTEPSEYFNLTIESKRKQNNFKKATLDICASLNSEDESNMILMEIKMISGFVADKNTVKSLLTEPDLEIKRFEIKENQINLYFVQLTNQSKCFQFDVVEELMVEDTEPANVKLYDYYDQDKITAISYSIMNE